MSTTIFSGIWPWAVRRNARPREDLFPARRIAAPTVTRVPRMYRVKVDMDRLRAHLTPEGRVRTDDRALRRWLQKSGFEPQPGNWWVAPEAALGQLAPSEVSESQPIDAW